MQCGEACARISPLSGRQFETILSINKTRDENKYEIDEIEKKTDLWAFLKHALNLSGKYASCAVARVAGVREGVKTRLAVQ